LKKINTLRFTCILLFTAVSCISYAQQITGVWKGKVKSSNLELKIIKSGDSLTGTSYYYTSKNNYRRYSIKGYFDPETNDVIWWDDILINGKDPSAKDAALNVADFNCPGEDKMLLEGSSSERDNKDISKGPLHLQKISNTSFPDEWDWVIDNYTAGTNAPDIIDSIGQLATGPRIYPEEKIMVAPPVLVSPEKKPEQPVVKAPVITPNKNITSKKTTTTQEKFTTRQNKLQMVIPVTAPVIELRFYDNAAIDGDSIAIFLNGHLLREHILLGGEPQIIKINAADLQDDNELVLVAENLGSIPPNTSYLVAVVGHKQYEARLFADEGTSALIRFIKEKEK
jgi:hypothetical protein